MNITSSQKVLVIRNDKLGDFMLAYPAISLLKKSAPDIHISVLVPEYTREMAEICPAIDEVLIDPGKSAGLSQQFKLLQAIRSKRFDAAITLFSTSRIGWLLFLARISYRLAPATKIAQLFYNHRLLQKRSRSEKPEFEYNVDLVRHFLKECRQPVVESEAHPFLHFHDDTVQQLETSFRDTHKIPEKHKLVFIHPGSGGSANNLTLEQYAQIANNLKIDTGYTVVITAGPDEQDIAEKLTDMLTETASVIYQSKKGLTSFAQHIQFADLFISGSTGPLHIAGALDVPTAAFYPRRRSATPLRWQTLNSENKRLAFTPSEEAAETDVSAIDVESAIKQINDTYFTR